jgi:LPXTG-motif cell wall-anchored protein
VGELTVSSGGVINKTYASADGSNLLKTYHAFAISSSATAPAPGLYADFVPTGAFTHVGHQMVAFPSTPTNKGLAVGMREQAQIALDHANFAKAATTLSLKQLHLQHIINLVEGSKGVNFKVAAGDPSDGFGVLVYASTAITHAGLAKAAAPTDATVVAFSDGLVAATNNVVTAVTTARNNALQGLAETSLGLVLDLAINNAVANLTKAVDGTDADGDGVAGSTAAEGGTKRAYVTAQDIGSLVLVKGAILPVPIPTATPRPPRTGDVDTGSAALGVVLAGLALMVAGAFLLLRRRGPAAR